MKNIDRLSEWTGSNVCIVWNLTRDTTIGKLIFRFYISRNIREKIPFIITMWIELWQKKKKEKKIKSWKRENFVKLMTIFLLPTYANLIPKFELWKISLTQSGIFEVNHEQTEISRRKYFVKSIYKKILFKNLIWQDIWHNHTWFYVQCLTSSGANFLWN